MRSLLYAGEGQVTLIDVPDPEPGPNDALVRIEASAVCGSEGTGLMAGLASNSDVPPNGGHEACGTIVDPGPSMFRAGDRVGLSAVVGCGVCDRCSLGEELHCRRGPKVSVGWHAELAAVPASTLRDLPAGTDAVVGALLSGDSLGVPARAFHRAPSAAGDRVVIIGAGPVGLGHVLVRSFTGAEVIVIEPSEYRRNLAAELGASKVLPPGVDIGTRPSLVIECTGRPECIAQALELVDNGGVVLQSGECYTEVPINPSDMLLRREITYTGSWYYATEDYPAMLEMVDRGLPLRSLCTHVVAVEKAQAAITDFLEGRSGKVVLRWP